MTEVTTASRLAQLRRKTHPATYVAVLVEADDPFSLGANLASGHCLCQAVVNLVQSLFKFLEDPVSGQSKYGCLNGYKAFVAARVRHDVLECKLQAK